MAYVMYDGCTLRTISTRPQPSYGTMASLEMITHYCENITDHKAERGTSLCANKGPPGGADLQSVAPGAIIDHEPLGSFAALPPVIVTIWK